MPPVLPALPGGPGLRIDDLVLTPDVAVVLIASTAPTVDCPRCGTPSGRLHSHYRRTVADLPLQGRAVALRLLVRRFRCAQTDCSQAVFCERLPDLLAAHARSTTRLTGAHRALGLALGGEAGSRLAGRLDMPTSPDTVLRRVKDAPDDEGPPPRHIGIDDWAVRKGQHYGTIVVDHARGRVLDLLPGRDGAALKTWLTEHPGVEVITRDRWAPFAQAAAEAAPQAKQVADRWHLLKNLREAVERLLGRFAPRVRAALATDDEAQPRPEGVPASPSPPASATSSLEDGAPARPNMIPADAPRDPSPREQALRAKREQRVERHREVRNLLKQGLSLRRVARLTGLAVRTVLRYGREQRCPDWRLGQARPSLLAGFTEVIESWLASGNRNASDLHRRLRERGCRAGYDAVRRLVSRRLGSAGRPGPRAGPTTPPPVAPPSARQLSFEFIKKPEDRGAKERERLDRLRAADAAVGEALELAAEFAAMVRKASPVSLTEWLVKADQTRSAEIRNFAAGIRQDEAAVGAALTEPWSNGPVEGQVNRLKLIKRQMYGRAGFTLLRARVRFAA